MGKKWGESLSRSDRLEQFKLVYDYIKFHIGLYLATPPIFAIVAESFAVQRFRLFEAGLLAMIAIYAVSGIHAGMYMGRHVNDPWGDHFLVRLEKDTFSDTRKWLHHRFYWFGLGCGLLGLTASLVDKWFFQ